MLSDAEAPVSKKSAIEFKSTSLSVPILNIFSTDLKQVEILLDEKISQAPEFFKYSPLLINLQDCQQVNQALDVAKLIVLLHNKRLIPIGICGGNNEQNEMAVSKNIPVHSSIRHTHTTEHDMIDVPPEPLAQTESAEANVTAENIENILITSPIRSGQRVYAKGDLTVLSHVSAGAEIMAEGHIHVYGTLRGRALAGVQGDIRARIFCLTLEAELVSIAGQYKISEEINSTDYHSPTQIYLQGQALIIESI